MYIILETMYKIIIFILCYTGIVTPPEDLFKLSNSLEVSWE